MAPINPPKAKKNASKKNKKSWRKNTDIQEVEEFLDDQRLEERLGGLYKDRADDALFVVDKELEKEEPKQLSHRLLRRKKAKEETLKCFQNLEVTGGVKDPKSGRNPRKSVEQRINPIVKELEKKNVAKGIIKKKARLAKAHRAVHQSVKKAQEPLRKTRRRTEFDFDLWGDNAKVNMLDKKDEIMMASEWVNEKTKKHNLKNTGKMTKVAPKDYRDKTSSLEAVTLPHAGTSYNPSYKDHQELLWKATIVELNKEKALEKIEYHTTRMFPTAENAPTDESYLKEMSEGLQTEQNEEEEKEEKDNEVNIEEEDDDEQETKCKKLKTRKQRRKARESKADLHKLKFQKINKKKNEDVFRVKTMKKALANEDVVIEQRQKKRALMTELKKKDAAKLSAFNYEEPEIDLKLGEELTGSLRTLKPEGNLLMDRFKSMQKRNVIETRVKHKMVRKSHKRKKVEKRSYKMPYEKPDAIQV